MEAIALLLANSDRQLNNLIEAQVLDVCYNRAFVRCTRTARVDEVAHLGWSGQFDLVVVAAENLSPSLGRRATSVSSEEVLRAIREIRSGCSTPMLAVTVFPEAEVPLLEAGADCVVRFPFRVETLKSEVRRLLRMPALVEEVPTPNRWSLAALLLRRFGRLKSA
jgi:DNA-binding response OmpR family regulator